MNDILFVWLCGFVLGNLYVLFGVGEGEVFLGFG